MTPELVHDLTEWVAQHCPEEPSDCLETVEGKRRMLAEDPDLARRMANHGMQYRKWEELAPRLLAMVAGQLPDAPSWHAVRIDRKAQELRKMGFRVIRMPMLLADVDGMTWPAAGYANLLAVGRQLFIPTFELGVAEDRLLADVHEKLGKDYEIVQVPAQMSFLNNGGVHCVFGAVREP